MDTILRFAAIMGLFFGIVNVLICILRILAWYWYNYTFSGKIAQVGDACKGHRRVYPIGKNITIAIIGIGWFICYLYR
jgi:hypothetical protein